jgi:uncharacterized protein
MQCNIQRCFQQRVLEYMNIFPVVAILGSRQCGKSTLIKQIGKDIAGFIYLDLEDPADHRKINDPSLLFDNNKDATICLDEVQYCPNIFPELRSIVDKNRRNGRVLLLGSASRELVNKSSESLAGRIGYIHLTPFMLSELNSNEDVLTNHWLKGGYPLSHLSDNERNSLIWRKAYIKSYLERDIVQGNMSIPLLTVNRLLQMLANNHAQLTNASRLGETLGVNYHTVKNYIDFFEKSFLVRSLKPYEINLNKRLTKSPKVFIRDSGLLHALLEIETMNQLLGHPVYGSSWEGYAIENIINMLDDWNPWFYRTATGCEIDLILTKGRKKIAFECKATTAPILTKGTYIAMQDTGIDELFVVAPVKEQFHMAKNIIVGNVLDAIEYGKTIM